MMFFGLGTQQDLLDEESVLWMNDVFDWALRNFNAHAFFNRTSLVYPTNEFFPGREADASGMAEMIFSQVKKYAGVSELPCKLLDDEAFVQHEEALAHVPTNGDATDIATPKKLDYCVIHYNIDHLRDPEVLIASYALQLAYQLVYLTDEPPPGGKENIPHVAELLAIYLGFGVLMANSANTQKIRSCGSCSGPAVERANFLSQYDLTYALAIFCALKGVPAKEVLPHLKKSLKSYFKQCAKAVSGNNPQLIKLQRDHQPQPHFSVEEKS